MAIDDATVLPPRAQDLTGMRFGRLTVIAFSHYKIRLPYHVKYLLWRCACDCGVVRTVAAGDLKRGRSRSCGCLSIEGSRSRRGIRIPDSRSKSDVYHIYLGMLERCHKENGSGYLRYGGVGIFVCDRWRFGDADKDGLACFAEDMGPRPSKKHSIDRIDGKKGYSPDNVRWATSREQNVNRSDNVFMTFAGRTQVLYDWAREFGIPRSTVYSRYRKGWDPERVLSLKKRP